MSLPNLTPKELEEFKKNRSVRRTLAEKSHVWFFSIYLGHYMTYPFAPFHHEMFAVTEDLDLKLAVLVAFRGSGKSTLMSLSYPIWAITGIQKRRFVVILSQTQSQARLLLANIKRELEGNELLKSDIGPFTEQTDEWGSMSIVISKYDARISVASMEQGLRGIRHGQFRPDLVICDDIEDLSSVKTREGRDKTWQWLTGDVLPLGDKETKKVVIGNLLHEDCLLMRLKNAIDQGKLQGKFAAYPLLTGEDDDTTISWPGKFPNLKAVEELKTSIGNESAWQREFLLRIIPDEGQVIRQEWIHYYDVLPAANDPNFHETATAIDLAISEKDSADYTAMVSAKYYGYSDNLKIYILPNPVNQRLNFYDTIETATTLSRSLGNGHFTQVYVEDVTYQQAAVQQLVSKGVPADGVKVTGDKRARLALTTALLQSGKILFPLHGCEELINHLVNFGVEKHEDLADAFSMLILKILEEVGNPPPSVTIIGGPHIIDFNKMGEGPFEHFDPNKIY